MTASLDFDRLLSSVLQEGPQAAPPTVVDSALTTARAVGQRRTVVRSLDRLAWPSAWHAPGSASSIALAPLARSLVLALLILALVALGLAGSGVLRRDPPPTPRSTPAFFARPFEYTIPAGSLIRPTIEREEAVAWVEGPDVAHDPSEAVNPGMQPAPWSAHGIIVGAADGAWSHSATGRFGLRDAPSEFLADLRDVAGVRMGAIVETALDGRPALTTVLPGVGGPDVHMTGQTQGLGTTGTYAILTIPSRVIVADIDGTTVFIMIWARTADDLETWIPEADAFVRSIHFLPEVQP